MPEAMPELGAKHECAGCGIKFYDLGKDEPICPKCGLNQLTEEGDEGAGSAGAAKGKAKAKPKSGAKPKPKSKSKSKSKSKAKPKAKSKAKSKAAGKASQDDGEEE